MVFQVSSSRASASGISSVRIAGRLVSAFMRSDPSGSTTRQCAPIQVARRQPLAKSQRPLTR
jgi:hypothetical protein